MLYKSKFRDVKLLVGNDQRYTVGSPKAIEFISSIAFHWYGNRFIPPSFIAVAHKKYPNLILLGDKPCETHRTIYGQ